MTLTLTDGFCGAGGSSQGATAVPGVELVIAANHWQLAVETHAENFPRADHDCADISQVDPRRYPATDLLWMSPECTNHSQAKGVRRVIQPDLFGETLPTAAAERSRATMWDVPRFAEAMVTRGRPYKAVIVENVVDAAKWVMWPAWLAAMNALGYDHQVVYLNSMHAAATASAQAPQSRDRLYVVFHRRGARRPDVAPRPLAWCEACGAQVHAVQSFKKPDQPWGRYRQQYLYRCPSAACRFAVVEPHALPAAAAIDWALPGLRIGDRDKPLSAKTLARIEAGLRKYARPMTFEARGNTYVRAGSGYARAWPVDWPTPTLTTTETRALLVPAGGSWNEGAQSVLDAMRTRTTRESDALVVPVEGRDGKGAASAREPLRTMTTRAETALVVPYYGAEQCAGTSDDPLRTLTGTDRFGLAFIAELRGGGSTHRDVRDPLATVTASGNHHMLVRHNTARGNPGQMCTPATEPARTLTTTGHQSLVGWPDTEPAVEDCSFRMLEPHEIQNAMAFRSDYRVLGNRRERVRQLGNAVTPPAAEFLIAAVARSLDSPF